MVPYQFGCQALCHILALRRKAVVLSQLPRLVQHCAISDPPSVLNAVRGKATFSIETSLFRWDESGDDAPQFEEWPT